MPDSPERTLLYEKMSQLAAAYMPLMLGTYRYRSVLTQPRLLGFKSDPFFPEPWKYLDISVHWLQRETSGAFAPVSPLNHPDLCTDLCTAALSNGSNGVAFPRGSVTIPPLLPVPWPR